ncbi:MAG: Lrp/AsnC family transcriptional regulator [Promethearchaeota archaeon]
MANMPRLVELDNTDKEILRILQFNAKASLKDIEKKVELSTTSIKKRIDRLIEKQVIKQYVALIDCRHLGYREMVMASLRVNSSHPLERVKEQIEAMERIKFAYVITGDYPIFVMAKCLDHSDSMEIIENLRNLPGVEEIKTQIVLDKIKEDPSVIIPE